jgi:ketosteroid isomerase-like protein
MPAGNLFFPQTIITQKFFRMEKSSLASMGSGQSLPLLCFSLLMLMISIGLQAQIKPVNMKKNKELVRKGFEDWANGTGSFFDLLAEDMVWTITGRSPISKTYTSRKQFLEEAIAPINRRLSRKIVPSLRELYADGDMVIALWDGHAVATDGSTYNNTYSWYMKLKDGKIVAVIAFFDSIELADLWVRVPDPGAR